jgi:spermidine/putrescine transport system ATP-binding protein
MQIELKRLQQMLGITFIYVTHDQEEAMTMSDRIAIINEGVLEQIAVPGEIYKCPATRFVADFIGESNLIDAALIEENGKLAYIKTADGKAVINAEGRCAGSEFTICVRPENMIYAKEPKEGFCIEGTITNIIYVGGSYKILFTTNSGKELKLTTLKDRLNVREGDTIYVYWDMEDVTVIEH